MRKLYIIASLLAIPIFIKAQGINFESGGFTQALTKAKTEKKVLFIEAWATWCGPCKQMAATTFKDAKVGTFFDENLLAIKVDIERGEGPGIKLKYGITGLPGYVFLDSEGNVIHRDQGSMGSEAFLKVVQQALKNASDPRNLSLMVSQYEKEKNNEIFLKTYLDKLKSSKSIGYSHVLEQYLSIQHTIAPSSKEMVYLLADHANQIVYNGKADQIIQKNMNSEVWRQYVRKNIRETYQKMPKFMLQASLDYAISKRDSAYLNVILKRGGESNIIPATLSQRKKLYTFFYEKAGMGKEFKKLLLEEVNTYIKTLDPSNLKELYVKVNKENEEKKKLEPVRKITPHAVGISKMLQNYAISYAKFAITPIEKTDAIKWAALAAEITPGEPLAMSTYADMLYMFDKDKQHAIKIKAQAIALLDKSTESYAGTIENNYERMKAGKQLDL